MGEDITRGDLADQSGWVTTRVAAQALRIDPRTVRKYIKQGKLEARVEGEGVEKTYLVSIDSIYALRGREPERTGPRMVRENVPREAAGSAVSEDLVALVRDLTTEVSRRSSEAAELRTRLELTERAESSQREALEQRLETERVRREQAEQDRDKLAEEKAAERLRREEAEREREELRQRLEAAVEAREPLQTPSEGPDRGDVPPGSEHPVERPSWWRKFFGFE
jgi:transposase